MVKYRVVVCDRHVGAAVTLESDFYLVTVHEIDHILGMIGFTLTFHTDNGGELSAREIIAMIKAWNPECTTVTGRPRTPRN